MRTIAAVVVVMVFIGTGWSQEPRKDRGVFVEPKNEFMDKMRAEADSFARKPEAPRKEFRLDFSSVKSPKSAEEFKTAWHSPPLSQGFSGMCWCFSTTSFYESEIHRLSGRSIKLSELYTVYWEYVEKARRFVRERGNSLFDQGSEGNAVARIWREYGIVPAEAYTGMKPGQKVHNHDGMVADMQRYLASVKSAGAWNEEEVLSTIRSILDHELGAPPTSVVVDGVTMTPKEYLGRVVKLNLSEYVEVLSVMQQPYYAWVEYEVPDNWWHSKEYFNVPLNEFMAVIKRAIRKGHTLAIGGDTSEPGYEGHAGIGVVPAFDIPSSAIDENARQFRFSNGTTTDDHGIHIVGYAERDGVDWYLVKDSGAGSRNNSHPGYYFYHEDYVKLKMLGFTVHKEFVADLLKKAR